MDEYNPATDKRIAAAFTVDDPDGKKKCKKALQEELGLDVKPDVPVIGMVGRLSNQKGLDLVDYVIADMMRLDIQLVVLGMGEGRYFNLFSWAETEYKGRVAARFTMDHALAHRIYAGTDMFLMPSQFEPCGLSQMIAMRYGTVPIVRETGGLRDTVLSYNDFTGERGMKGDYSWTHSAKEYIKLYQALLEGGKDPEPEADPEENPVVVDI